MWALVIALVLIGGIALLSGYLRNHSLHQKIARGELDSMPGVKEADVKCCGQHQICEKESLLAAVSKHIEYYDDEELDALKGLSPDLYTPEQVELFHEVFHTMHPTDVPGWVRSLQLRGIALPDTIKDEVLLVVSELRFGQ